MTDTKRGRPRKFTPEQEEEICKMYDSGLSQQQIATDLGCSQTTIYQTLRRSGKSARLGQGGHRRGPTHPTWKGGRAKATGGYVMVKNDNPDFVSMENRLGYILEHRLVMAQSLGRPLTDTETVHHINADILDNRLENLQLRQGRHGKNAAFECLDCGSHNVAAVAIRTGV